MMMIYRSYSVNTELTTFKSILLLEKLMVPQLVKFPVVCETCVQNRSPLETILSGFSPQPHVLITIRSIFELRSSLILFCQVVSFLQVFQLKL
jgi:hypothetical protein